MASEPGRLAPARGLPPIATLAVVASLCALGATAAILPSHTGQAVPLSLGQYGLSMVASIAWIVTAGGLGYVIGTVLSGLWGPLPSTLRWAPLAGTFSLLVMAGPRIALWVALPGSVPTPQGETLADLLGGAELVAAAIIVARRVVGTDFGAALASGLLMAFWLLGTHMGLRFERHMLPTAVGFARTPLALAVELVVGTAVAACGFWVLIGRRGTTQVPSEGPTEPASNRLPIEYKSVILLGGVVAALFVCAAAINYPPSLPASHHLRSHLAAATLQAVVPSLFRFLGLAMPCVGAVTALAYIVERWARVDGWPAPVGLAVGGAWFLGVAPALFAAVAAAPDIRFHNALWDSAAGLVLGGLVAYLLLRTVVRLDAERAVQLAGLFLMWESLSSGTVLRALPNAVFDVREVLARALLLATVGMAASAVHWGQRAGLAAWPYLHTERA